MPLASCDQHQGMGKHSECYAIGRKKNKIDDSDETCVPELGLKKWPRIEMKDMYWNWDETCALELGLSMCTGTGIKQVYWNWD